MKGNKDLWLAIRCTPRPQAFMRPFRHASAIARALHAPLQPPNLRVVDRLAAAVGGLIEQGVKEIAVGLGEFAAAALHHGRGGREYLPQVESLLHRAVTDLA